MEAGNTTVVADALNLRACLAYMDDLCSTNPRENEMPFIMWLNAVMGSKTDIWSSDRVIDVHAQLICNGLKSHNLLLDGCTCDAQDDTLVFSGPRNQASRDEWHVEQSARILFPISNVSLDVLRQEMKHIIGRYQRRSE